MPRRGKKARTSLSGASSAAATAAPDPPAAVSIEHDRSPGSLYGLYSTPYEDYCSGAWYPISFVAHAPPTQGAATGAPAAAAAASASAPGAGNSSSGSNNSSGDILIRWSSKTTRYAPERLSLALVRGGSEFVPLPGAHMRAGKRVLVRDLLESSDFDGVSFWLATLKGEPQLHAKTKKRGAEMTASVEVEYQNPMWPATTVPVSSIFVLPRVKGPLQLIPQPTDAAAADAEEAQDDGSEADTEAAVLLQPQAQLQAQAQTQPHLLQPAAASSSSSHAASSGSVHSAVLLDGAPLSLPLVSLASSPHPFTFSSPPAVGDLDVHLPLTPAMHDEHNPSQLTDSDRE